MGIASRIKVVRLAKKLSSKDFANKIGVDNSQFSKIEHGKLAPTLQQIMDISSIFGVSSDWLLFEKGEFKRTIGTQNDADIADQDADENIKSGETIPFTVLNHPSYQNLLNLVQELAAKIDGLEADNNKLRIQNDLLSDLVNKGLSAKK